MCLTIIISCLDESSTKLSTRQREFYEENGFLVIPNLISDALIDECAQVTQVLS